MSHFKWSVVITSLLSLLPSAVVFGDERAAKSAAQARAIELALDDADKLDDVAEQLTLLRATAEQTQKALPDNVLVADLFETCRTEAESEDLKRAMKSWRKALTQAQVIVSFQPLIEAPLPEGFPDLTPVGEIQLQEYPAYRLARTEMKLVEGAAFWTLFNHIKQADIAMTAPVEITYGTEQEALKQSSMAFLYRSTSQGKPGDQGNVTVTDVPELSVVSLGMMGDDSKARVANAKSYLERWVAAHAEQYEVVGPIRVHGYNSPFVPEKKRYFEVQLPVRKLAAEPVN